MASHAVGPCPFARIASAISLASLVVLPAACDEGGSTIPGGSMLLDGVRTTWRGGGLHPVVAMLGLGVGAGIAALIARCPRRAWRATLVGTLALVGVIASGAGVDPAHGVPAIGLHLAAVSLGLATGLSALRARSVPPESAPDPRDEVGDPRIDRSPGPDVAPDEVLELVEANSRPV
jgi:hypothetical protein